MPKLTKYPRLRTLVRKGANGKRWVYYYYDMRAEGVPDLPLGKDHAAALVRWDELHNKKPQVKGRLAEAMQRWREKVLPDYPNAQTRRQYGKHLDEMERVFGRMAWHEVTLPLLREYLKRRTAKTQGNRALAVLSIVWNYARMEGITVLPWPAAGMARTGWKNPEKAREIEVTDEMFDAIYAEGDQLLRDAMDLASATGMRITDVRTIPLPHGDILKLKASKTTKKADFDVALSAVLPDLIARRRANKQAEHLMLLAGPSRRPISYRVLNDRYVAARAAAAAKARENDDEALAVAVEGMILRDCRKYAADQAGSLEEASRLLQHSDQGTTRRHYRTRAETLKPVR
jgi:hypothetical protein